VEAGRPDQGPVLSGGEMHQPSAGGQWLPVGTTPLDSASIPQASPWIQTPIGRALRSGAVLGEPPEQEEQVSGLGSRAVNSAPQSIRSATGSEHPEAGMWGAGLGAGRLGDRRRSRRSLPPDTEWPVPRGVPPVLQPGPEPIHDPGPGVIGIDR
jgi:hypothetical protein